MKNTVSVIVRESDERKICFDPPPPVTEETDGEGIVGGIGARSSVAEPEPPIACVVEPSHFRTRLRLQLVKMPAPAPTPDPDSHL